jgi:histidyl-tRNA synthetase
MFQPPRGTRDYLPEDQLKKNWVIDQVREVYEAYGFEPLGTPAFENLEMLVIKSGDDIINQIYNFKDKSDRELALRFEHTASTVRVVASHRNLVKPFKRYTIGPTWRYERPSETRFREFWQADVDIFGVESSIADAEVLSSVVDAFIPEEKSLDAFRAVDKLGKIGRDRVIDELRGISPYEETSMKLLDLLELKGDPSEVLDQAKVMLQYYEDGVKGCKALEELVKYAKAFGFAQYIRVDLSLARGLDYYTGPVFEVIAKGYENYGSIAGGGRYDEIIELFGGPPTCATGVSFGVDRVTIILEEKGAFADLTLGAKVYVAPVNEKVIDEAIKIAQKLRAENIPTIVDMMGRRLGKQFEFADKKGIPKVIVVGERELAEDAVTVRDMNSGEQTKVKLDELTSYLQ